MGAEAGERAHLARRWKVSQRKALEALLMEAEEKAVKALTDEELEGYFASGDRD